LLFDEVELSIPALPQPGKEVRSELRVMTPQRDQVELRALDLDSLLAADRAARTVWADCSIARSDSAERPHKGGTGLRGPTCH